jgi:lipopolysaccharide export system protein LptC
MVQRFWNTVAVPIALAIAFLAAAGCRASRPGEAQEVVPELKLEGVLFRAYRGEELRAFGEAEVATFRRDSTELSASEILATFPQGAAPLRVAAPAGEGVLSDRTFGASGGVVLRRADDEARTERARYEPAEQVIRGDDPVVVEGQGFRLEGPGFTLDPASGDLAIQGGVRVLAGTGDRP